MFRSSTWLFVVHNFSEVVLEHLRTLPLRLAFCVFDVRERDDAGSKYLIGFIDVRTRVDIRALRRVLSCNCHLIPVGYPKCALGYVLQGEFFDCNIEYSEVVRMRDVISKAKLYGDEDYWLYSVWENCIDNPGNVDQICEASHSMIIFNESCSKGDN